MKNKIIFFCILNLLFLGCDTNKNDGKGTKNHDQETNDQPNGVLRGACLFKRSFGKKKFDTSESLDEAIKYITGPGDSWSLAHDVDGMLFVFKENQ